MLQQGRPRPSEPFSGSGTLARPDDCCLHIFRTSLTSVYLPSCFINYWRIGNPDCGIGNADVFIALQSSGLIN
ncbi:hypothetical protein, partial [Klebsiella pneumoniae]|uniref:hypothetical protein n=1 Tax=Klebsiella pneumoniae TaxID=573 RepID=UPI001BA6A2F1